MTGAKNVKFWTTRRIQTRFRWCVNLFEKSLISASWFRHWLVPFPQQWTFWRGGLLLLGCKSNTLCPRVQECINTTFLITSSEQTSGCTRICMQSTNFCPGLRPYQETVTVTVLIRWQPLYLTHSTVDLFDDLLVVLSSHYLISDILHNRLAPNSSLVLRTTLRLLAKSNPTTTGIKLLPSTFGQPKKYRYRHL